MTLDAQFDATDRGFLLGDGLFETLLVVDGETRFLSRHLDRMRASGTELCVPVPGNLDVLAREPIDRLWREAGEPRRAALRVTLSAGKGRGLVPAAPPTPRVDVALSALPAEPETAPLRGVTVAAHRIDPSSASAGHKTLSWLPFVLARREALARGADVALLTTIEGDICEADHANIFVARKGVIVTPSLDRGVLPGITRARVLSAARSAGRVIEERPLTVDDFDAADEAWLTSSLNGVRALGSVDDRSLPAPGQLTLWLAACLSDA